MNMCLSVSIHLVLQSLGPSMLLQMVLFHSFYGWVVFHCVYRPYLLFKFNFTGVYLTYNFALITGVQQSESVLLIKYIHSFFPYRLLQTIDAFFIHSSVNGHLGCFHIVAIAYSAAVNIGVHVSCKTFILNSHIEVFKSHLLIDDFSF